MSDDTGPSFGEQAARFSLYAPFMALLIGLFANGTRNQPSVVMGLFVLNCLLVVAGLLLGIIALLSIRRYGAKRILGRAIVGVIFNGAIVAAMTNLLLPAVLSARVKNQLPGQWSLQAIPTQAVDNIALTLTKDGTFVLESSRNSTPTASLSGTWVLTRDRTLGLMIERVKVGSPSAAGTRMGLGTVKLVDDKQMVLKTDTGEERYVRVR